MKKKIWIGLVVIYVIASIYIINGLHNKTDDLRSELEIKSESMRGLADELHIKSTDNEYLEHQLSTALKYKPDYNRYIGQDDNKFTSYILDNPLDRAYEHHLSMVLDSSSLYYNSESDLDFAYTGLWRREMEYAVHKLRKHLDDESWEVLVTAQENFEKYLRDGTHFRFQAFYEGHSRVSNILIQPGHLTSFYKERTIELLEYLYIFEKEKPSFLNDDIVAQVRDYGNDQEAIMAKFWGDMVIVSPLEYKVSYLQDNQLQIVKLIGYRLENDDGRNLPRYSIMTIEIYDEEENLIQRIDDLITFTYMNSSSDYGLSIVDWNFDGYMDITLFEMDGGTMGNMPSYYWLWDDNRSAYIYNDLLSDMSQTGDLWTEEESQEVVSTYYDQGYHSTYYKWVGERLEPTWMEGHEWVNDPDNPEKPYTAYLVKSIYKDDAWIEVEREEMEEYY